MSSSTTTPVPQLLHQANNALREPSAENSATQRKQFAELVTAYSHRTAKEFLSSGEHYTGLANFLDQDLRPTVRRKPLAGRVRKSFVYIHVNKVDNDGEKTQIVKYDASSGSSFFSTLSPPESNSSHLVFLSGWQSREWLRVLGAQCHIDPELYRRHLNFLAKKELFDLPPLPSAMTHIWRIRITTLCNRDKELSPINVKSGRDTDREVVKRYQNELSAVDSPGCSIIRRYAVHNETAFSIEQDISLSVHMKKNGGWIGFVWLDNGKPLEEGPTGPWVDYSYDGTAMPSSHLPVIQLHPKIVFDPPDISNFEPESNPRPPSATSVTVNSSQSALLLPLQYGLLLDRTLMRKDALYAFSELFAFAASSEKQFINFMQEQVQMAIRAFRGQEEWSLETLRYSKVLLDEHTEHIEATISSLENEGYANLPRATDEAGLATRNTIHQLLLKDFRYLLSRTKVVSAQASEGTGIIMNDVMLKESRQQMTQAREVGRLSLLAYFFLPLSFVTSLFGMNFVVIDSWKWAVGAALVSFVVVMTISLILCYWDYMPWRRSLRQKVVP